MCVGVGWGGCRSVRTGSILDEEVPKIENGYGYLAVWSILNTISCRHRERKQYILFPCLFVLPFEKATPEASRECIERITVWGGGTLEFPFRALHSM